MSKYPCQNYLYSCNTIYNKYHSEALVWMIEEENYILCIFCITHIRKYYEIVILPTSTIPRAHLIARKLLQNSDPVFIIERYM